MLKNMLKFMNKRRTMLLGVALLLIVAAEIALTCVIPAWRESFFNILQLKDSSKFLYSLVAFLGMMLSLGAAQGLKVWVARLVSFEFRAALTNMFEDMWSKSRKKVNHHSQAMTESLRNSTELFLDSGVEIVISLAIVIGLMISNLHNPVILLSSLAYTAVVSVVAILFNRPMIAKDRVLQEAEGRLRDSIIMYRGDRKVTTTFKVVVESYYSYIFTIMNFTLFTRLKGALSTAIPYIVLSGGYFSGAITLGAFMAGVATFELLVVNATILLILYPNLNKARASQHLINDFYKEIKDGE